MKTHFTFYIILFLSLPQLCSAQKIRFTNPTNFWEVKEIYTQGSQTYDYYFDFWYGADTTIGSTVYKKMLCSDSSRGCVREDTAAGLVFYYNTGSASEDTLYNYNLSDGDTILFQIGSYYFEDQINSFPDSVQINGIFYKNFDLICANCAINHPFDRMYALMEGIGSLSGPLFPTSLGACENGAETWTYDLLCFSQNNVAPVFTVHKIDCLGSGTITNTTTCGPTGMNNLQHASNSLRIYPNPVKEHLTIETNIGNTMLNHIIIFDISGREVYSSDVNESKVQIDMSAIIEGIYFVETVYTDSQGAGIHQTMRKIVKQ